MKTKKKKEVRSFFDMAVISLIRGLVADMERISKPHYIPMSPILSSVEIIPEHKQEAKKYRLTKIQLMRLCNRILGESEYLNDYNSVGLLSRSDMVSYRIDRWLYNEGILKE